MNVWPPNTLIVTPAAPRSAIVSTSGYVSGSHMMICGLMSSGATTDSIGVFSHDRIWPSVVPNANVISSLVYSSVSTSLPMAGPPARISTLTPVGCPCETSDPDTILLSMSTS